MGTRGVEVVLAFALFFSLWLLGISRVRPAIRLVALQGAVLGLLPLIVHPAHVSGTEIVISIVTVALRGLVFPQLLLWALSRVPVKRETHPPVHPAFSPFAGLFIMAASIWLGGRFPTPEAGISPMVVPAAFSMLLIGVFLLTLRRTALMQVMGFLVMENGIYTLAIGLSVREEWIVQLGVLLDVFVAVFIMGVVTWRIGTDLGSADTDVLSQLTDSDHRFELDGGIESDD